jgi:lipoprotein-anchoring transpeptidase ErfK/SrfK
MYWYVKYPLIAVAAALLFGCLYLVWTRLPDPWKPGDPAGVERPVPAPPSQNAAETSETLRLLERHEGRLRDAADQLAKDRPVVARALAASVLADADVPRFSPLWFRAADIVGKANVRLFSSDIPAPEKVRYVIQPGDTLIGIATRFRTTVAALEKGNRLDSTRSTIYPGMVISVYPANWSIEVIKSKFVLLLHDDARLFKCYRVGIGKQDRTPVGVFTIANKLREPVWTPPGRVIPYGDPENVLGTRWLGLEPSEGTDPFLKGFGLHGTWHPETIGTAASEGCVRLHNDDINELFEIVSINTRVVIKEQ